MSRLALTLALSAVFAGCVVSTICTDMGCMGTYSLSFEADSWEDGEYALTVLFDGMDAADCIITVPLADGAACDGASAVELADGVLSVMVFTPMNDELIEADIVERLNAAGVYLGHMVDGDRGFGHGEAHNRWLR